MLLAPALVALNQTIRAVTFVPLGARRRPSLVLDHHVIDDEIIDVAADPAICIARFNVQDVTCLAQFVAGF